MQSRLRLSAAVLLSFMLFSCSNKDNIPDVSNIKIDIMTQRFEKELFGVDSAHLAPQLDKIIAHYPSFGENFLSQVLNCNPKWSTDTIVSYVGGFTNAYRKVYDTVSIVFKDFSPWEKEIKQALQFVHHYFPEYKLPSKIITFIGPIDGIGDALSDDAIIVGLQDHLGQDYSLYQSEYIQQTYPSYVSKRFEPSYIVVFAVKNIISQLYPENTDDKPLVQQMVEKGKRLYVLSKLLPYKEEYKIIGYTKEQLDGCYKNEREIWDLFLQNNLLQNIDDNVNKSYVEDGPKTQELGEEAPGNIGSFAGWQIVKKFMSKNPKMYLKDLMSADPEKIFEEAKYKP
jgi:hypothetical protein